MRSEWDPREAEANRRTHGVSFANLLVVAYSYREPDVMRLISAWQANTRQREIYEKARS